ncbi:MAG: prolyl oligopeptidase family serine peptidase [Gemmatimonadota bacterium]|nr:prolyl oligopeptidase family serine peptidase [Gemmatimonadota bacterium]
MLRRLLALAVLCLASSVQLAAQAKPTLTPKDLGPWESLSQARLSANGEWLSYAIARNNEENELRLRGGGRDTTIALTYGQSAAFSPDSRWLGYLVGVSPKERERLQKEKKPVRTAFALRQLASGEVTTIADVSAFSFNPSGGFVAVTKVPAEGKKASEVLVLDLGRGTRVSVSNVVEQAWSESKALLAFTVTVDGNTGNSVSVFDGATGAVRVLDTSSSVYRALSWRPKSDALAVLRTRVDKDFADTAHTVLAWASAADAASAARTLEAAPAGMRIADGRRPAWSRDGGTLYLGARSREPVSALPKKSDDKVSDVEIWHASDIRAIPEQRAAEQRDLRATVLAAWPISGTAVTALGTNPAETGAVVDGDRFATEFDRTPYTWGQKFGRPYQDLWVTEIATGARRRLLTKVRHVYSADPAGTYIPWFDGRDYWVINIASGERTNLTARLTAGGKASFVDREADYPTDLAPPIMAPSWPKDGAALYVYSEFDIWALALDGSGGRRLTDGARDGVVHRLVSLAPFTATPAERAIDRTKPVYVSLFGKRSKQSGYARLLPSGEVQRLVLADASIGQLAKADSADRVAYVRQRFDESPNVWVAAADFSGTVRWSNTNPFAKDFAWGKAELISYTSTVGRPLQAILYYPANYDAKKKYPMIVYTYELLTQGYHRFIVPRENDYYNANVFTQHGYFVLMPDIVFRPREPGVAVLHSVEPAVRSVIARGLVDPANIGHCGHSQGGYEAFYLATHSRLFKTAVAGAGISDMISFAGQMHWNSIPEFAHWETGQFRMEVPPWEDMGAMLRNSPLNRAHAMQAQSILIEVGGDDGTVDKGQGAQFWNYARRAGKHAVMLLYPGEGHGLTKKENAVDYERRILQWFGHYLKGEPAPRWITDGQSWVERKAVLDANK